jgi:hypothetical protein
MRMDRDGFGADAHRYLDGEPSGELGAMERASADRFAAAARTYGEGLGAIAPALDDAVMAAVRRRGPVPRRGAWRWFTASHQVAVRPVWVAALAVAAALVLWLAPAGRPGPRSGERQVAAVPAPDTVFVRFELIAPEARSVAVAGTFTGWRTDAVPMARGASGVWSVTVPLPVGEHRYDFVVDHTRWVPDPTAPSQVDDGFGGHNSIIVVGPKGLVRS